MFLDNFALFLLAFTGLVLFYGVIVIHDIPYEIAKHRGHPHCDAGRVAIKLRLLDDLQNYYLPQGSAAEIAVYSDHFHHVSIMRKILLRMKSWPNYLYLDH